MRNESEVERIILPRVRDWRSAGGRRRNGMHVPPVGLRHWGPPCAPLFPRRLKLHHYTVDLINFIIIPTTNLKAS